LDEGFVKNAMNNYGSMVLRIAKAITGSREDAEDVFSETFFVLWQQNKVFNSDEHLKAWLIKVATNKSKNVKYSAYNRYKEVFNEETIMANTQENPAVAMVENALMRLSADDRAIIHLYHYEGYTYDEIAKMLELKSSSIRSRVSRVQSKMRELLSRDK